MKIQACHVIVAALMLAACGKTTAPAPAVAAVPLSAELQKIYDGSCKTCHSVAATGAPQVADAQAWAPRLKQGREVLLSHVINGYQKMPPMGLCMQCSEDDFLALTQYMSGSTLQ